MLFGNVGSWWIPTHLAFYAAIAITVIGVWQGFRYSPKLTPLSLSPIRFVNIAGLKLAGVGCLIEIIASIWNEIFHRALLDHPGISPANALLTVGMLTVNLGIVIGLVIEGGIISHGLVISVRCKATCSCSFRFVEFLFDMACRCRRFHFPRTDISFIPSELVSRRFCSLSWRHSSFVPVKKVMPRFGSVVAVGFAFNAVTYIVVAVYSGMPFYFPWGFLPVILFDLVLYVLTPIVGFKRTIIFSSLIVGVFFWATYYPFTIYLFPWSFAFQLPVFAVVLGSVVGGLTGNKVYASLSSVVLSDVAVSV